MAVDLVPAKFRSAGSLTDHGNQTAMRADDELSGCGIV